MLLRLATRKFGVPSDATRAQIERLTELPALERLADRVLTAATWEDLLSDGA